LKFHDHACRRNPQKLKFGELSLLVLWKLSDQGNPGVKTLDTSLRRARWAISWAHFKTLQVPVRLEMTVVLICRAAMPAEVGIYIDGMRVGNAYGSTAGNVPNSTPIPEHYSKATFFSTGGYQQNMTGSLSSALHSTPKICLSVVKAT